MASPDGTRNLPDRAHECATAGGVVETPKIADSCFHHGSSDGEVSIDLNVRSRNRSISERSKLRDISMSNAALHAAGWIKPLQ